MEKLLQSTSAYKQVQADVQAGAPHHAYLLLFDDAYNLRFALKTFAKLFFGGDKRISGLIDTESFCDCLFFPQADKKFMVDEAERVGEEATLQPVEVDKKLFVIGDFAEANATAQNKLLKLLEEPPQNVIFLLGATSGFSVLPTVLSRVEKLEIPPFEIEQITQVLQRKFENSNFSNTDFVLCAAARDRIK